MMPAPASGPLVRLSNKVARRTGHKRDGLLPVPGNKEALNYRLALIDSAVSSLDVQMFIWMDDLAGRLVLERILQAADRGVRVRLLVDDLVLGSTCTDRQLAAINTHPNVEVRLYNPFYIRGSSLTHALEMLCNPRKKNQRMHNKTIIADNSVAILSGRNIGNQYFGFNDNENIIDLGVIACGPVVREIGAGFDEFWSSKPTYNVAALAPGIRPGELDRYRRASLGKLMEEYRKIGGDIPVHKTNWSRLLGRTARRMHPDKAHFVGDPPEVPSSTHPMIARTMQLAEKCQHELILANLYIVPDQKMLDLLARLTRRGVRVRLLVASIGSNHNPVVYNQYQKHRKLLIKTGVEVHEMKPRLNPQALKYLNTGNRVFRRAKLHAKGVVVDHRYCSIGTLNLDGRSRLVNTEEGLMIDSPAFVKELRASLEVLMQPENAWRCQLDSGGNVVWVDGHEVRRREPTLSMSQRIIERILRPFDLNNTLFPDAQLYKTADNTE